MFLLHFEVFPRATLTNDSINQTYRQQDTGILVCNSTGGFGNTYQWLKNGLFINESSNILILPDVADSTGGIYSCVVTNAAGNHSATTLLFVFPYFIEQPIDRLLTSAGSTFNITCIAAAFPDPEYQWGHEDGRELRVQSNMSIFIIDSVQFGDEGMYYCNATSTGLVNTSSSTLITGTTCQIFCMRNSNKYITCLTLVIKCHN